MNTFILLVLLFNGPHTSTYNSLEACEAMKQSLANRNLVSVCAAKDPAFDHESMAMVDQLIDAMMKEKSK